MEIDMWNSLPIRAHAAQLVVASSTLLFALTLPAQQRRVVGVYDTDFPTPVFDGQVGVKDQSSLTAVNNFLKATNTASHQDITLDGSIMTDPSSGATEKQATLVLETTRRFRFDVQGQEGAVSTRTDGMTGALRREDASILRTPMDAAGAGLLMTPWVLADALSDQRAALRDGGTASIQGQLLHKVTFSRPPCPPLSACPIYLERQRLITDLYFDTRSDLLIKSVDEIRLSDISPAKAIRVITYGGYRTVRQSLVPFEYSETLGGQFNWVFAVSTVTFGAPHDASYFTF